MGLATEEQAKQTRAAVLEVQRANIRAGLPANYAHKPSYATDAQPTYSKSFEYLVDAQSTDDPEPQEPADAQPIEQPTVPVYDDIHSATVARRAQHGDLVRSTGKAVTTRAEGGGKLRRIPIQPSGAIEQRHLVRHHRAARTVPAAAPPPEEPPPQPIPRPVGGPIKVLLHLYSGQRREGDVQYWTEHLAPPTDAQIYVLSIDIANDANKGDLTKWTTVNFWILQMREGKVAALLAGPPCETWSAARTRPLQNVKRQPRPLRSRQQPWGLSYLSTREYDQLDLGNQLLRVTILCLYVAYHTRVPAVMEHPATAEDERMGASSWLLEET